MTPIKLSVLAEQVKQTLQAAFTDRYYYVIADICNYSFYAQKNYHFFDLVEKAEGNNNIRAKISAAAWGAGHMRIREFERSTGQKFMNDINVLLRVTVQYHAVHGLTLNVTDVDINFTIGILEQQKQDTLKRLLSECSDFVRKEGGEIITRNKELRFRKALQRLAIISSASSAGLQDFTHTIESNAFHYTFQLDKYFASVQGEATATDLYEKLLEVFNSAIDYDAVIIVRGGGAQTDFLVFDQFMLSKIVAKFPIPVITGIGHHKNETIVDLVAHTTTKTPTKAAEFIIAHNRSFEERMIGFQKAMLIKSQQLFSINFQALSQLNVSIIRNTANALNARKDALVTVNQVLINGSRNLLSIEHRALVHVSSQVLMVPQMMISNRKNDLINLVANMKIYNRQFFVNQSAWLEHLSTVIRLMSPENILKKGFAIVKKDGVVTCNAETIQPGDNLAVILSGKEIDTTVISKSEYNGQDFRL